MADPSEQKYLFVTSTGNTNIRNDSARRSHVMQHRFSQKPRAAAGVHMQVLQHNPSAGKFVFQISRNIRESQPPDEVEIAPQVHGSRVARRGSATVPGVGSVFLVGDGTMDHSRTDHLPPWTVGRTPASAVVPERLKNLPGTERTDPGEEKVMKTEDMSLLEKEGLLRLSTSPLLFFGTARVDPLNVLPFKLTAWDEVLLDRFSHNQKWPWCPVSGQSQWAALAMSDQMVFSATMYSWSMAFRNRLTGSEATTWLESNPEVLTHKINAISLINTNLSNVATALTDETVAAIAAMANLELIFGLYETASYHMNGLKRLIDLRGGFDVTRTTSLQNLIYRLVSWNSLMYANIYGRPLYFPALELWDMSWKPLDSLALPGAPIGLSPTELQVSGIGNHEAIDILQFIRRLCYAEQRRPLHSLSEQERMIRADMCSSLEARLTRIIQHPGGTTAATSVPGRRASAVLDAPIDLSGSGKSTWNYALWRSTALAAYIYIHHFLRGVKLHAPQFRIWAQSLRASLDYSDRERNDRREPSSKLDLPTGAFQQFYFSQSLLLWVLSVGALASAHRSSYLSNNPNRNTIDMSTDSSSKDGTGDHSFFISQLAQAKLRFGLGWHDYQSALQGFFWTGREDEALYHGLWIEVVRLKNERYDA